MVDWTKAAFVFPGQGSQAVGMGREIAAAYPAARSVFEEADDILGFKLSALCFEGSESELNDTINTQPALYVCGIAALRALQAELPQAKPALLAGHSLGEFTALTAAGALSFDDGVRLVRERGRLMKEAGEQHPGAMAALLGLDVDAVREVVARASGDTGKTLVLANDNCPGQIVISGDETALERGIELAKEAGAKRAVKLAVSIASHSPLMQTASEKFRAALDQVTFAEPEMPVYGNVHAAPVTAAALREELSAQMTSSVRWTESVQAMIAAGAATFVELGSGDVLTGLLKRIDRACTGIAVQNSAGIAQLIGLA